MWQHHVHCLIYFDAQGCPLQWSPSEQIAFADINKDSVVSDGARAFMLRMFSVCIPEWLDPLLTLQNDISAQLYRWDDPTHIIAASLFYKHTLNTYVYVLYISSSAAKTAA